MESESNEWNTGEVDAVNIPISCIKSSIVTEGVIKHASRGASRSPRQESLRSYTTITKYPQAKSSVGSGRKTATTKLNYGYGTGIGSSEKRSQEDVESSSAAAQIARRINKTSHSNMTISSLMKSMAEKTTLRASAQPAHKTKTSMLSQRLHQPKAGESLEHMKKTGTVSGQKSNKASSSRTHKGKSPPTITVTNPQSTSLVAHHTRSFAMTQTKQGPGSFIKQAVHNQSNSAKR